MFGPRQTFATGPTVHLRTSNASSNRQSTALQSIHNSGHFGPPLPFWAPGPPALAGLLMASYAAAVAPARHLYCPAHSVSILLPANTLLFWKKMLCCGNMILWRLAKCCDASIFVLAAKFHIEHHDAVRSSVACITGSFRFCFFLNYLKLSFLSNFIHLDI